jgi:general L-amino acid transport system permease protein
VTSTSRPPLWRDVRVLRLVFQLGVLAAVVALVAVLYTNVTRNSDRLNIPTDFDYLDRPSQFTIPGTDFRQTQPVRDALWIGFGRTVRLALFGIVAATVLGTIVGIARLSGNFFVRSLAAFYVEAIRNIPLYIIVVFSYSGLALVTFPRIDEAWEPLGIAVFSNRGAVLPWIDEGGLGLLVAIVVAALAARFVLRWRRELADRTGERGRGLLYAAPVVGVVLVLGWVLAGAHLTVPSLQDRAVSGGQDFSPELFAIAFALIVYTASHIAEIVRGSIQAVAMGQGEAAWALALSPFQRMRDVVLPQAFRIAVPPLGNQYLNLMKNSSLAYAVAYVEVAKVTSLAVSNASPAVPAYGLALALFLGLSLAISAVVNIVNRQLAVPGQ